MSLCSNCITFAKELSTRHRSEYSNPRPNDPCYLISDFQHVVNDSNPSASAKTCPLCWLFLEAIANAESVKRADAAETMRKDISAAICVDGGDWMSDNLSLHGFRMWADQFVDDFCIYATPGMSISTQGI